MSGCLWSSRDFCSAGKLSTNFNGDLNAYGWWLHWNRALSSHPPTLSHSSMMSNCDTRSKPRE